MVKQDSTTEAQSDRAIVITRVFNAPRSLVLDAWTQPASLIRSVCNGIVRPDLTDRLC